MNVVFLHIAIIFNMLSDEKTHVRDELFTRLPNRSYTVRVNSAAIDVSLRACLDRLFDKQPVTVTDATETQEADLVVVRDGEPVARSDAEDVLKSLLLLSFAR